MPASRPPRPPRGATSVVFSCQEKGTGAPYAAKILKKTVSEAGEGLGRGRGSTREPGEG